MATGIGKLSINGVEQDGGGKAPSFHLRPYFDAD